MRIDLQQGSEDWHEFRLGGVGASDVPIIMGVSPWKSAYDLFLEKTGRKKQSKSSTPAMQRGVNLEPVARSYYELRSGIDFEPAVFQEDWMLASLDGWNEEFKIALEIKCPNLDDHLKAIRGEIPEKYIYQVQWQMMISGAKRNDYFSFDGSHGVVVQVKPDLIVFEKMKKRAAHFWNCVVWKKWEGME